MDVRCCCNPGKLLGTIPNEKIPARELLTGLLNGEKIKLKGKDGSMVEVEVAECRLPLFTKGYDPFMAIKSNDLPIEYYEQIDGFVKHAGPQEPRADVVDVALAILGRIHCDKV